MGADFYDPMEIGDIQKPWNNLFVGKNVGIEIIGPEPLRGLKTYANF